MPLFDLLWLKGPTSSKPDDRGSSELDELFKADGSTRATYTVGDNCHLSALERDVESSVFSIPLDLFRFLTEVGNDLAPERIATYEYCWSDDTMTEGQVRSHVSGALLEILDGIDFFKRFKGHGSRNHSLDVLIERCKSVSSPLFLRSLNIGLIDVVS